MDLKEKIMNALDNKKGATLTKVQVQQVQRLIVHSENAFESLGSVLKGARHCGAAAHEKGAPFSGNPHVLADTFQNLGWRLGWSEANAMGFSEKGEKTDAGEAALGVLKALKSALDAVGEME